MSEYSRFPVINGGPGGPFLPLSGGTMTGNIVTSHDILSSGRVTQGETAHTMTDGETFTIQVNWPVVLLNAAVPISVFNLHMTASPVAGQTQTIICFGGGIATFNLTTTNGNIISPTPPTSLAVGETLTYQFFALGPGYWALIADSQPGGTFLPLKGGSLSGALSIDAPTALTINDNTSNLPSINLGGYILEADPTGTGNLIFDGTGIGGSSLQLNDLRLQTDRAIVSQTLIAAVGGIGVGNSTSATIPGTVVKKMEVFDAGGVSLGFVPIYDTIT